jgi:hypothetical protein
MKMIVSNAEPASTTKDSLETDVFKSRWQSEDNIHALTKSSKKK